jgi:hypothetical protein
MYELGEKCMYAFGVERRRNLEDPDVDGIIILKWSYK